MPRDASSITDNRTLHTDRNPEGATIVWVGVAVIFMLLVLFGWYLAFTGG